MSDFSSMSDDDLLSAYQKAKSSGSPPTPQQSPATPAVKASPLDSALAAENVPPQVADIARSIYQQESGSGRNTKTSNTGAVGGMQIIPATFKSVADPDWDINNPEHNARAGVRYISQMYDKAGGDPALTAAGYYGGPGAIDKARNGIAVSDPRNPNAPNTLQYGQQVASRLPKSGNPLLNAANAVTDALLPSANAATPSPYAGMSDADLLAAYQKAKSGAATSAPAANTVSNPFSSNAAPPQDAAQKKPIAWSDVPGQAVSNLIPSAVNVAKGVVQAVAHPIDTVTNVWDAAAGGLRNALPDSVARLVDSVDTNPQATARATQTADSIGAFYKDRYGNADGFKNALATDPAGILSDVATVATGGAGAVAKGAGVVGKIADLSGAARIAGTADRVGQIANTVSDVANAANPINLAAQGAKGIAAIAEPFGSHALGVTTQVGAGTIRDAAKAGLAGDAGFLDNLSGKASMMDVLDAARQNVQEMGRQKAAAYRSGMADISKDQSVLNFDGIDKALQQADAMGKYKGQVKNPQAAQAVNAISDEINNWKSLNPADFHTPEGMDALKQKIGGILESIPFEQKTARTAAGNIYSAVKDTIADQAPTYAKVMKDYSTASDQIKEIERAFSLGQKASADTALRKLQSLTRNNANTNYGYRQQLADTLQEQGGQNLSSALAGQAMSSWIPRGLLGGAEMMGHALAGAATHGATLGASLAAMPLTSPRLVGYGLYGAGRGAGMIQDLASRVPVSSSGLNLASEAGNLNDRGSVKRIADNRPAFADGGLIDDEDDDGSQAAYQSQAQGLAIAHSAAKSAAEESEATAKNSEKRALDDMGEDSGAMGYKNGGLIRATAMQAPAIAAAHGRRR